MLAAVVAMLVLGATNVAGLRERAVALEQRREYAEAAATWQEIAEFAPDDALACWRAARSHWNAGLRLPAGDAAGRRRAHRLTREWADRGLAADPDCGECRLYKAAGIGGEVRERGIVAGALEVSEIAALLESGIEIMAARPDAAVNPELEELYYAAARLYLSVPDSGIVRWALRLEGDRARAVEYLRRATAIAGPRADYQIELGTALVCLGRTGGDAESQVEGFALLQAVAARDDVSDDLRRRARERLESPGCG